MFKLMCVLVFVTLSLSARGQTRLQDPTKPSQATPQHQIIQGSGKPVLSSILIGRNRKLALLDDRLVTEGERARGMTVERILEDRVELSNPQPGSGTVVVRIDSARVIKERK